MRKDDAVGLPEAYISHRSPGRLRIRIPSRRGDVGYFDEMQKGLSRLRKFKQLEMNPVTGGVLFIDEFTEASAIGEYAREQGLFDLKLEPTESAPLMQTVAAPVARIDELMKGLTRGRIDLASSLFLTLVGFGIYEIARGKLTTPPWYTAFWYALGLFSMYVIDKNLSSASKR
jgi:Heavy metal associated domain 2